MFNESYRKHEVAFCADVSKWTDKLFEGNPSLPFGSSDIESFGRGSQKRQDFRVYERKPEGTGKLALCGEVKLPGSQQGRSPFDPALMQDAFNKANAENCRFFFTWNVEHLALFDRALWDAESMHERCIGQWKLELELNKPSDVTRAEVIAKVRDEFLPRFFADFAQIYSGVRRDIGQPPSEFYVTVLESLLSGPMGPVRELRDYLAVQCSRNRSFDARVRNWMATEQQWSFDRNDPTSWREAIDRAARSMVYVLSNRILFYQAVRLRNYLPQLKFPRAAKTPQKALDYLRDRFQEAVDMTGDYEPVFFPEDREWAALQALSGPNSLDAWDRVIRTVDRFNFKEIPTDILGHIFQKLISPEERHKFGQHYTDENIVDVINAFCIRHSGAVVFDPGCGSGSFLVRAYYRKHQLDKSLSNQELLEGLYGCDINPFPAHLATLNLAARNISNEENYPRVVRKNFFTVAPGETFCELPNPFPDPDGNRRRDRVELPILDAVVGNPPYVRHEHIPKSSEKGAIREQTKEYFYNTAKQAWPDIELSKQSDLHVYFWPVAAQFLRESGYFGFLTSSSWLDVRYGFLLQRWVLLNFRVLAIIESTNEPWFEDARVKTAVTILQRCKEERKRNDNLVRFVRLERPLSEILGIREDEAQHQKAAEKLRDTILATRADSSNDNFRIMVKRQGDLWNEGCSVAQMFTKQKTLTAAGSQNEEDSEDVHDTENGKQPVLSLRYGGGKWGRYLRAPDFYFHIVREFGNRFVRLGEVATIRFGIKSGCDAFFMPRNVSMKLLATHESETEWQTLILMRRCKRSDVESGKVAVVQCGDGTLHPIEAQFVKPEVHSLMQVDRPVVSPSQLDRVVLWINKPLKELAGTYAHHYLVWGSKQTFESKKSKSVPIPKRATCAGRSPWYDLTGLQSGIGFWPMAQKYRHIVPWNPYHLPCNHNLFDIHAPELTADEQKAFMAILNSTLVGLFKHFYGRYAGSEGTLKTEIVDVLMLDVPSPLHVSKDLCHRLSGALEKISQREVTHLVEEDFLNCHTEAEMRELQTRPLRLPSELQRPDRRELDLYVFELLGVNSLNQRNELVNRLYLETALYYREQRVQDIQSTINRRRASSKAIASPVALSADAWGELETEWQKPLSCWLNEQVLDGRVVDLPEGDVRLPDAGNFFDATTLYFGKKPVTPYVCTSRAEAELLFAVSKRGLKSAIPVPDTEAECRRLARLFKERVELAQRKFEQLAEERGGTDKLREQIADLLLRWFVHGKPESKLQENLVATSKSENDSVN